MLQLIDRRTKFFLYFVLFLLLSTQIQKNKDNKDNKNNLNINLINIEVTGLSKKNNIEVYESLKFLLKKNIFLIDKKDFQDVLNKNNLIEYF